MRAALRRASSRVVGWLADRRIPTALRSPAYRAYSRLFGVDLSEVRLPLSEHPSLGAFFVRRLRPGARPWSEDPSLLPAPCDGTLQALDRIERGTILQAKGRPYRVEDLLGPLAAGLDLDGGWAWTIYLAPRDYHRVHAPLDCELGAIAWVPGDRRSVRPGSLARRGGVFSTNERAVLRLEGPGGPLALVLVAALNVARIRVVGVGPYAAPPAGQVLTFRRGDELARFEMGSTVVLLAPPGSAAPIEGPLVGARIRMGAPLARRGGSASR